MRNLSVLVGLYGSERLGPCMSGHGELSRGASGGFGGGGVGLHARKRPKRLHICFLGGGVVSV